MNLNYTPTERIRVDGPVDRIKYITTVCNHKNVLDLGCYDETARIKECSGNYLFEEISIVAAHHVGVDNSVLIPDKGVFFGKHTYILKGDIYELGNIDFGNIEFDVIIAGELIEHLPDTLRFFTTLKDLFPGKRLICTTPNATSFSNMVLSFVNRESAHKDHLQVYSLKTLNTLCNLSHFQEWKIIPYHVRFTEMIMQASSGKKQMVKMSQTLINGIEKLFPMTAGGYIIDIVL